MSTNKPNSSALLWHTTPTTSTTLNDWLFDQGSLTQRLTQQCQGQFTVQVLNEGWHTLTDDECQALTIVNNSLGWVREVFLCGAQQPWIFARSVASQKQLQSSGFDLSQLGTRSLGERLFSHQAFHRGALKISKIPCQQLPQAAQQQAVNHSFLWARRSCFTKNALGVLVAEVFLPKFWQDSGLNL